MSKVKKEKVQEEEIKYSKEQFMNSKQYAQSRDLLKAMLRENENYTTKEVDKKIENFMKRKV